MNQIAIIARGLLVFLLAFGAFGRAEGELVRQTWTVNGVTREALVQVPAGTNPAPVVFAFHGHGGTMQRASSMFGFHTRWSEAIVVYMQGLNTPGRLTDPQGLKAGWQHAAGDQGDRDLKFFDAVLASLRRDHKVDDQRLYSTGHSNGGGFTYLLWAERGDTFAAVAPSAAAATPEKIDKLKPKPVMHLAGEKDALVKFEWQKLTLEAVKKVNQVGEGKPWEKNCILYPSTTGAPMVTFIHPGAHNFPAEAPDLIVKFFKEHAKPVPRSDPPAHAP